MDSTLTAAGPKAEPGPEPEPDLGRRLADYRSAQLGETFAFLRAHSAFYRDLLPAGDLDQRRPELILRDLPPLKPDAWEAARHSMRTGTPDNVVLGYTSGSTGNPKVFLRQPDEFDAVRTAFDPRAAARRTLVLVAPTHGAAALSGFSGSMLVHFLCNPEHYAQVSALLERRDPAYAGLPPITDIRAQRIKALTLYLLRTRGRVDDLGIERITAGRFFLSPRWRDRLERWWGAEVTVAYGFSEMAVCNALECRDCGYFHMPPMCLAEVLDEEAGWQPVRPGGRGALAVTGFHPFVTVEPRVRYVPGDLVELAPDRCPRWGEGGFRPLGRQKHCARRSDTGQWICPADVFPALDDLPELNRVLPGRLGVSGREYDDAASPRFILESGDRVRLRVELRSAPAVWDAESALTRQRIQDAIPDGVEVVLHGPGDLGDVYNY
ncbi:MAG TPA: hypothetical protein VGM10_16845 [Actinocrinis sp.]|jgi:hypothetical protein